MCTSHYGNIQEAAIGTCHPTALHDDHDRLYGFQPCAVPTQKALPPAECHTGLVHRPIGCSLALKKQFSMPQLLQNLL